MLTKLGDLLDEGMIDRGVVSALYIEEGDQLTQIWKGKTDDLQYLSELYNVVGFVDAKNDYGFNQAKVNLLVEGKIENDAFDGVDLSDNAEIKKAWFKYQKLRIENGNKFLSSKKEETIKKIMDSDKCSRQEAEQTFSRFGLDLSTGVPATISQYFRAHGLSQDRINEILILLTERHPKPEIEESIHLDTLLTMPFDLNKEEIFYHYSDRKIEGDIVPVTVNIGNKLSPKPRKSIWWSRNPNNWAFCVSNFIRSNIKDAWKNKATWGFSDEFMNIGKFHPSKYKDSFVVLSESFYKSNKNLFDNIKVYRYSKKFKFKDLGRGTEYAVDEWTSDDPVKPDDVEIKTFNDMVQIGQIRIVDDETFKNYADYFTTSLNNGKHFNDLVGRDKEWFKYNFDQNKQKRKAYEQKYGIQSYKEAHVVGKYDPPMGIEELKQKYPKLLNDPVRRWRAENGIELIYKDPSEDEQKRIWSNWLLMDPKMKDISDKKSIELFGIDNKQHNDQIMAEYAGGK